MTKEEKNKEIALFRFSLIAPAVAGTFAESSRAEYFRNIASKEYRIPYGNIVSFSPLTFKKWYEKYTKGGLDALIPKARIDLGTSRALSLDVCNQIMAYKEKFPYITGKKIYEKLIEEGYMKKDDASCDTIYRFLKAAGLSNNGMPDEECLLFEFEHANDCWQADTTNGPIIHTDGKARQTYLIVFIDDASRLIVHGEFFFSDNAVNMQKAFKKAILKFGCPRRLFCDNGGSYRNDQLKWICAELGIVKIHSRPYHPEGKSKCERSHRTEKDRWMNCTDWNEFHSLEDVNKSYHEFLDREYNNHIHSTLGMTPKERYLEDFDSIRFMEKSAVDEGFLHRVTRKVTATATVSLFNTEYEVMQQLIGKKINIRYNPADMSEIYVYDGEAGKRIYTAKPVRKIDNAKRKRRTNISYGRMDGGDLNV